MDIRRVRHVVVLTGAGISAESGVRTFRASDGLWEDHRIEDVATPEGFTRDPALVHRFYNERRRQLLGDERTPPVRPNEAHFALARYERQLKRDGGSFYLVTQNVDNLHEQAGSQDVRHMHGELLKMRCVHTGAVYPWSTACDTSVKCACCNLPGSLRPHIVWFGELPFYMDEIYDRLLNCDLFVSIGTSGNVYPAAGFFQLARQAGATTTELNLEPSQNAHGFDECHYGPASQVVPEFFETARSSPGVNTP